MKTTNKLERTYQLLQGWQNVHQVASCWSHVMGHITAMLLQVIAVKVLLHLRDGDLVEAKQVYNEAFR